MTEIKIIAFDENYKNMTLSWNINTKNPTVKVNTNLRSFTSFQFTYILGKKKSNEKKSLKWNKIASFSNQIKIYGFF